MKTLSIQTNIKREVVDITDDVAALLDGGDGMVSVAVLHTTAAITCADLDPGTDKDLLEFLERITPDVKWRHPHNGNHAPDHLLSSIIGPSVTLPVQAGKLILGTWQRIILVELDGPRERAIAVTFSH